MRVRRVDLRLTERLCEAFLTRCGRRCVDLRVTERLCTAFLTRGGRRCVEARFFFMRHIVRAVFDRHRKSGTPNRYGNDHRLETVRRIPRV